MSAKSGIQWTDATWNPVTGCHKVSPGCKNCYAERDWARLAGNPKTVYFNRPFTDVQTHPDRLDTPLRWTRPRMVFVNSMSDLFHEAVPFAFIDRVFAVMSAAKRHTFQVLTKRAERLEEYVAELYAGRMYEAAACGAADDNDAMLGFAAGLPNVWLGVSAEDQQHADERLPHLLQVQAAVRFLSAEPLLGPLDLIGKDAQDSALHRYEDRAPLNWVIVGGESGRKARPFDVAWARTIIGQCREANVPVFMKQVGSRAVGGVDWMTERAFDPVDGERVVLHDRHGGNPEEWPEDMRVREWPHWHPVGLEVAA